MTSVLGLLTDLFIMNMVVTVMIMAVAGADLEQHMKLLIEEEKMMQILTAQADDLTRQNEEIINDDGCCCIIAWSEQNPDL